MKSSLLCAALVAGSVLSQSAQSTETIEEIKNPVVRKAVESLSFEDDTWDELLKESSSVQNIFKGHAGNAAYMFAELGNFYLKSKNGEKAANAYKEALNYSPKYEDLLSFLHRIGVSEGQETDLDAIKTATKKIIGN